MQKRKRSNGIAMERSLALASW